MSPLAGNVVGLLQLGQTKRWHTQTVLKEQTVAQHVYNMMWLVYAMTEGRPSQALLLATLQHDAGEQVTGDMPGHTKRNVPGLDEAMDKLESDYLDALGVDISVPERLGDEEAKVLALADCMEGWLYALKEFGLGNTELRYAAIRYKAFTTQALVAGAAPAPAMQAVFATIERIHYDTIGFGSK